MPKIYAIIHDGLKVLVGSGGRSGDPPALRSGLHLPGGRREVGETNSAAVIREVLEETGIVLAADKARHDFDLVLDGTQVYFIVFQIDSVEDAIVGRTIPDVINVHDEPFEAVQTLAIAGCYQDPGFSQEHWTDWFGEGLFRAIEREMFAEEDSSVANA